MEASFLNSRSKGNIKGAKEKKRKKYYYLGNKIVILEQKQKIIRP